jgi:hypothetical protein
VSTSAPDLVTGSRATPVTADAPGRAGPRWIAWVLFVAFFVPVALWSVSTPLWASPDENYHSLKAWSVAHGEFFVPPEDAILGTGGYVSVPQGLLDSTQTIQCLAFRPQATGDCVALPTEDTTRVEAANPAGRYNPVYYFLVGLPTLVTDLHHAPLAMRIASAALFALFASWAIAALAHSARPGVAMGAGLLAFTPMTLFLGAVVNPNGLEIAAAAALWANLGMLAYNGGALDPSTRRSMVRRAALAASAMVTTRGLSPVWLAVIVVCCLLVSTRHSIRLFASRHVLAWGAVAALASVFSLVWIVVAQSLKAGATGTPVQHVLLDRLHIASSTQQGKWRTAVGSFGWLDAPLPDLVSSTWLYAVVGVAVLALLRSSAGGRVAILVVALAAYALPVLIEAESLNVTGVVWQGRYTLPLYVGVPILAAIMLGRSSRRLRVESAVGAVVAASVAIGINVFGFALALHRNSDGLVTAGGRTTPFALDGPWQPRLGGITSVGVFTAWVVAAVASVALLVWQFRRARPGSVPDGMGEGGGDSTDDTGVAARTSTRPVPAHGAGLDDR